MRIVDLGKHEPIATAPRDGTLVWVYSELVGEVLARHIGVGAWRGSRRLILPTHWRPAAAEEVASFERENPRSHELQAIALRLQKSCKTSSLSVVDPPSGDSQPSRHAINLGLYALARRLATRDGHDTTSAAAPGSASRDHSRRIHMSKSRKRDVKASIAFGIKLISQALIPELIRTKRARRYRGLQPSLGAIWENVPSRRNRPRDN